mgnify:CR=1 FL=1
MLGLEAEGPEGIPHKLRAPAPVAIGMPIATNSRKNSKIPVGLEFLLIPYLRFGDRSIMKRYSGHKTSALVLCDARGVRNDAPFRTCNRIASSGQNSRH